MLYSEWKEILAQSGEVAAALCINDIEDLDIMRMAYENYGLVHKIQPERISCQTVIYCVEQDGNWLQRIDSSRLSTATVGAMMIYHSDVFTGKMPYLKVDQLVDSNWIMILRTSPEMFNWYRDEILECLNIFQWVSLCNHNKFFEQVDVSALYQIANDLKAPLHQKMILSRTSIAQLKRDGYAIS